MTCRRTSSRQRSGVAWWMLLAALTVVLPAAACGGGGPSPAGPPDQTGAVLHVTSDPAAGDVLGTILVGSLDTLGQQIVGDASVAITSDTVWTRDGKTVETPPLDATLLGQRVAVKFTGPVRESFPVQATAAWIELLPTPTITVAGRTMWAGGPYRPASEAVQPEPDEQIDVHWADAEGPLVASPTSDADGRFTLELRPGLYLFVTKPGDDKTPAARTVRVGEHGSRHVKLVEQLR